MSLEQALAANTTAINSLIAILQQGGSLPVAPAPSVAPASVATHAAQTVATPSTTQAATNTAPAAAAPTVTYQDIQQAVIGLSSKKGRDAAVAVLKSLGVENAKQLTEAQWPGALAQLQAAAA